LSYNDIDFVRESKVIKVLEGSEERLYQLFFKMKEVYELFFWLLKCPNLILHTVTYNTDLEELILIPVIIRAAETWTFSNKLDSLSVQLSRTKSLYSRTERTKENYIFIND
jgi:hypothetical protein